MPSASIERRLPQSVRAPGAARALVQERVTPGLPPLAAQNLLLVISELVSNGVRHARGGDLMLRVTHRYATVRVEVENGCGGFRLPTSPDAVEEAGGGGLGLHMVATVSERWGIESNGTTTVWAEVATAPAVMH